MGMRVTRIHHGNDDLTVVNAARVSMDKMVGEFVFAGTPEAKARKSETGMGSDDGLIDYLVRNNHWTPLGHPRYRFSFQTEGDAMGLAMWAAGAPGAVMGMDEPGFLGSRIFIEDSLWGWLTNPPPGTPQEVMDSIRDAAPTCFEAIDRHRGIDVIPATGWQMRFPSEELIECETVLIEAPIFVFRQWMRSNVGIVYNEVSRRYVDDEPDFFWPDRWRARPDKSIKQGSGSDLEQWKQRQNDETVQHVNRVSLLAYTRMLALNTAPEQARIVLPQNMMTKLWMTATNDAFERVLGLREDSHAQGEIQELAAMTRDAISS